MPRHGGAKLATIHGAMVCSLGRADDAGRRRSIETLEQPRKERSFRGLVSWRRGTAAGPLVGGNLAMLHASAASARLRIPEGAVVFLEDIGERPYRVDRMLTNLTAGGHLARASAVLVGDFTDCAPGPDRDHRRRRAARAFARARCSGARRNAGWTRAPQ